MDVLREDMVSWCDRGPECWMEEDGWLWPPLKGTANWGKKEGVTEVKGPLTLSTALAVFAWLLPGFIPQAEDTREPRLLAQVSLGRTDSECWMSGDKR